jgi:hypothetical protein
MLVPTNNPQEAAMRRLLTQMVLDVDFVDGDSVSNDVVEQCEKHLMAEIDELTKRFSLRTINGLKVMKLHVAEIKGQVSL